MPDHAAMFSSLHLLLVDHVTPHVVSLHSSKCQALKSAILNIAVQLVPSLSSQVNWFAFLFCFTALICHKLGVKELSVLLHLFM